MKRYLKLCLASFVAMFVATVAFGQIAPSPFSGLFTAISSASVVADAGTFGTLGADGGFFQNLTVNHINNPVTLDSNILINGNSVQYAGGGLGFNGCGNQGVVISNVNCGEVVMSGAAGVLMDAGVAIGAGALVKGVEVGSCALASGTCNAAVQGASGLSNCYCDFQGGNWAIDAGAFTCHARADAGSATVWVAAGATAMPGTPTVGVHCDN